MVDNLFVAETNFSCFPLKLTQVVIVGFLCVKLPIIICDFMSSDIIPTLKSVCVCVTLAKKATCKIVIKAFAKLKTSNPTR